MSYHEERAALARLASGIVEWVADLGAFVDWLGPLLVHATDPRLQKGRLLRVGDGRGLLILPRRLSCLAIDEAALEEVIHFLLRHGAGDFFRLNGDMGNPEERALAEAWEQREEAEMRACLLAILMPAFLAVTYRSDHELAEAAGVSVELAAERRLSLRQRRFFLDYAPAWSAWHTYSVTFFPSGLCPRLRVKARIANGRVFEVPVPVGEKERTRFQINADLLALSVDEFHVKYRAAECPPAENADLSLQETYALAAELFDGKRK